MRPNIGVLRSAVLPMLTETGIVERETGETVFDEDTGTSVPVVETVYDGPVLVRPLVRQVTEEQAGGTTFVVGKYEVTLPADVPVVRNDIVKVTNAPHDAALIGEEFTLLDVPVDAWQVARFCTGERVT